MCVHFGGWQCYMITYFWDAEKGKAELLRVQ
jgi:hypothetical protein